MILIKLRNINIYFNQFIIDKQLQNNQQIYILINNMEKEECTQQMIDQIIDNVIGYSQSNGDLLNKYNDQFYLNYFDRFKIDQTIKKVPAHQKQLQISEFVRLFLSVIAHKSDQTLYLTMSLAKLYKKIKEEVNNQKGVKFSDFTSFLCNKISQGDPDLIVPMKQIPMERMIPDISKVRDIDIHPPPILNKVQMQRPKITKDKNKKDKKLDEKKPVAKFIFSPSLNSIITLGRLSSSITLYDPKELKIQYKIIPSTCKLMAKDVAILSIAYCQRDQRIGCIINNIGVTFWQASDNFATQKILGANKTDFDPKACGDKIYYLNLFNQWATTDRQTIYFWDIKQQVVVKTIKRPHSTTINDICQINHIRSLLVSYNMDIQTDKLQRHKMSKSQKSDQHQQKMLILYQDGKQKSKLILGNPGCHAICYNPCTQLVVCLGYQSNICVYEIDAKTFDINLISQLQAHTSILTCVSNIPDTSMIISGDDIGHVKLWQLNYMRCLQGIRIAKSITQISCSGNMLIYADSRINTIPMDSSAHAKNKIIKKDQQSYGIYQFFRKEEESLWIITRKQAREISINTGRIKNILVICNNEQDISAAAQVYNGFLIGTSKGEMTKFGLDGQKKWRITAHEGQIHSIKVDLQNHLIVSIGGDNNLSIWAQKSIMDEEGPRKKISFQQRDINLIEVCPYANLLLVGSTSDDQLIIWNYDNLKLAYKLVFDSTVTAFQILPDKHIFVVATANGLLYAFSYARKQSKLKITLAAKTNINDIEIEESQKKIRQQQDQQQQVSQRHESIACKTDRGQYISKLSHCQDNNMIIGATPKGILYCFQPLNFAVNFNYRRQYEPTPTLKRPMKQSFEHELFKNQFLKCNVNQMEIIGASKTIIDTLWYMPVHKDSIYFLNLVNLEKKYACTLCVDGYFKLTQLNQYQGTIVCSHKMCFPLPVKWDIDVQNYCDLKNHIHEGIVVIDSIIKNYSYELTLKQQTSLNITPFMEKMVTGYYKVKQPQRCAQLMKEEFSQADVKQIAQKQTTLKNLQAYKRLQMIKKQSQPSIITKQPEIIYRYQTSAIEKQSIRNFLQPSYLPKLLNKNSQIDTKKVKGNDLVSRIQQAFNFRQIKRMTQKQRDKQNKYGVTLTKAHIKLQDSTFRKNASLVVQSTNSTFIKDKTVKQILSEINSKLYLHKKAKNKVKESISTFVSSQNSTTT